MRPFQIGAVGPPTGFEQFAWPPLFKDQTRPLDLEIGCGVGFHPIRYARMYPERNLVAIEHTRAKFEKFRSRIERHEPMPNLLPLHGDAIRWVSHAFAPGTVARCFLLYPNPEPKASNKRWLRMPFMARLLEVLKPGAELVLASNESAYIEEAKEWARNAWSLELIEERSFDLAHAPVGVPRTHFEKKYLQGGQRCFDLRFRKP